MRFIFYVFITVVLFLVASLSVMNAGRVSFNFYLGQVHWPLSLLLLCAFVVGCLFSILFLAKSILVCKAREFRLKRQLAQCAMAPERNSKADPQA